MHHVTAGLHQSYYPHPFVKCCHMFCNIYLMFKSVDFIFLEPIECLWVFFHVLFKVFHVFSYLNTCNFFQNDLK